MDSGKLWSAGVARKALVPSTRTHNPTPAAERLLGSRLTRQATRVLKRGGRKRYHRGNPIPAIVGSLVGGIGIGKGPDAKKQALRVRNIDAMGDKALAGDAKALAQLEAISLGREGFGVAINPLTVGHAAEVLERVSGKLEAMKQEAAAKVATRKQEAREAGAAAAAREARFLEAGTSVVGSIGAVLARRSLRPRRRRRRAYY